MADFNALPPELLDKVRHAIGHFIKEYESLGDTAPVVQALADRGWFINGSHTPAFTHQAFKLIKRRHYRKVDKIFEEYYMQALPDIEERMLRIYPDARSMIRQAFKCFGQKMYHASVPLLLILSEYIANYSVSKLKGGKYENFLFRYKGNRYLIVDYVGELVNEVKMVYGINRPLIMEHLINTHTKNLPPGSLSSINRHLIIHGLSTNFGTRLNNLKAFCFIDFIDASIRTLK